jgi:hypothetical protein
MEEKFVVYENWQATQKAVVHIAICGHAKESKKRIEKKWLKNNHAPNDRWFGYLTSIDEAIAFGSLLPNRQLKLCGICLKKYKEKLFKV